MYTAAARLGCQLILCRLPDTGAARLSGMAMVGWAGVGVVEGGSGAGEGGGQYHRQHPGAGAADDDGGGAAGSSRKQSVCCWDVL